MTPPNFPFFPVLQVSVIANHSIMEVRYNGTLQGPQVLQPVQSVTVCLKLTSPPGPSAERIPVQLNVSAVVPLGGPDPNPGGTVIIHSTQVVVFVLPEPIITSQGPRLGDFMNCELVHNQNRAFEVCLGANTLCPDPWASLREHRQGHFCGNDCLCYGKPPPPPKKNS